MPSFQPFLCQETHFWDAQESSQSGQPHLSSDTDFVDNDDDEEGEELEFLLNKEEQELQGGFERRPDFDNDESRMEAVEWIVKAVEHHSFSTLTGILAVNYLDRFLHDLHLHRRPSYKPWMGQLTAVACLSLAAKVEETRVPLLLDLQQLEEETEYLFEPKTIQRMEILILSKLEWRMNPVTPLPFLHHIARRLTLRGYFVEEFFRRSHFLLLYVVYDSRFMWHRASAMATATMVYVMTTLCPSIGTQNQDHFLGILGIEKEKVKECCRVIQEVVTNTEMMNKRKMMRSNGSPKGVMELSYFTYEFDPSSSSSVSSSPEQPLSKKIKSLTSDNTTPN